jgi:SAM-dependent methyltransferase
VLDLLQPRSVIDVGCGRGTWLSVFKELGIEDFLGIDGDWVDTDALDIPQQRFRSSDLAEPMRLDRMFDLVVSVEVAEHLPRECAGVFVQSLTRLGPAVLFSAGIPYQGGTDHVNEQWPDYWAMLFRENAYEAIDCLRGKIWNNDRVKVWYAQNLMLFADTEYLESHAFLKRELAASSNAPRSVVHPRNYVYVCRLLQTMQDIASLIPAEDPFILVDDDKCRSEIAIGRQAVPFLEREGQYWGAPADSGIAIRELERLRKAGATFAVFAWPAFWWLKFYSEFERYLRTEFTCALENERLVVFDLRQ